MRTVSGGNHQSSGRASFNLYCRECGELVLKPHKKNRSMFTQAQVPGAIVGLPHGHCMNKACSAAFNVNDPDTYSTEPTNKKMVREAVKEAASPAQEAAIAAALELKAGKEGDAPAAPVKQENVGKSAPAKDNAKEKAAEKVSKKTGSRKKAPTKQGKKAKAPAQPAPPAAPEPPVETENTPSADDF